MEMKVTFRKGSWTARLCTTSEVLCLHQKQSSDVSNLQTSPDQCGSFSRAGDFQQLCNFVSMHIPGATKILSKPTSG